MRRGVAWLVALLVPLLGAAAASAHGDPGSVVLRGDVVFLDARATPSATQAELAAAVESANEHGLRLRVAVIASERDLGRLTSYWRRPRSYAAYLTRELASEAGYRGRVLVVMPAGLALAWPGHDTAPGAAAIASVRPAGTAAGLAESAVRAVRLLAQQAGVTVSTADTHGGSRTNRDRVKVAVGAVGLLLLVGAVRLLSRRRATG